MNYLEMTLLSISLLLVTVVCTQNFTQCLCHSNWLGTHQF